MARTRVYYGKIMNGYEFVDFMRKFNWRSYGRFYKPYGLDKNTRQRYAKYHIDRNRFEGWKNWFDKTFPEDTFNEKYLITYYVSENNNAAKEDVIWWLEENGFKRIDVE